MPTGQKTTVDTTLRLVNLGTALTIPFFPFLQMTYLGTVGRVEDQPLTVFSFILPVVLLIALCAPYTTFYRWQRPLDWAAASVTIIMILLLCIGFMILSFIAVLGSIFMLPIAPAVVAFDQTVRGEKAIEIEEIIGSGAYELGLGLGGWLILASCLLCFIQLYRSAKPVSASPA